MYNKLFGTILDSSVWLEADTTRIVWMTLLASMDEDGFCRFASVTNVSNRALVSIDAAQVAIKTLESPDPNSSDPDNDGRRVERVPGGWIVLNATKYRELATREQIKASGRKRAKEYRDRNRSVTPASRAVTETSQAVTQSDTDTYTDTKKEKLSSRSSSPESVFEKAYQQYPRHVGKGHAAKAWKSALRRRKASHSLADAEDFIYQRVMTYAAVCARVHREKGFTPHMATWLNGDRFLDDPSEWAAGTNGHSPPSKPKALERKETVADEVRAQLKKPEKT